VPQTSEQSLEARLSGVRCGQPVIGPASRKLRDVLIRASAEEHSGRRCVNRKGVSADATLCGLQVDPLNEATLRCPHAPQAGCVSHGEATTLW